MDNGCLDSGGGTAAPADADAGVDAVLTPGERAQHPHGVGLVLRLAEHLALALDHRVKAADDVIGVFLGHGAGWQWPEPWRGAPGESAAIFVSSTSLVMTV